MEMNNLQNIITYPNVRPFKSHVCSPLFAFVCVIVLPIVFPPHFSLISYEPVANPFPRYQSFIKSRVSQSGGQSNN